MCLFCKIIAKEIPGDVVYEDEHALAFKDLRPVAPTHVLVVPKKHIAAIHDLTPEDAVTVGNVLVAARRTADQLGLTAAGYRLVINDGDAACQTVHHRPGDVLGCRQLPWPPC